MHRSKGGPLPLPFERSERAPALQVGGLAEAREDLDLLPLRADRVLAVLRIQIVRESAVSND